MIYHVKPKALAYALAKVSVRSMSDIEYRFCFGIVKGSFVSASVKVHVMSSRLKKIDIGWNWNYWNPSNEGKIKGFSRNRCGSTIE